MRFLLLASASAALVGASSAAHAQDWTGFYVGVTAGYADRSESSGESIAFDTNLDGTYGDTVNTSGGVNAFGPGFCGGSYNTNAAAGGCRKDDDDDIELSIRAGYDYQFAGNWVVGGVIEYSELQLQDAVTAFSTTPAAYNFTRKLTDTLAVRARAGYAMGDNRFYVTGGYAQGDINHSFHTTNTANVFPETGGGKGKGYQLGFGYERKLTDNISVGLEFLRTSLDDDDYGVRASNSGTTPPTNAFLIANPEGTDFLRTDDDFEYNSFRATVAWRF
jgi:opacity protein-like surface antigen